MLRYNPIRLAVLVVIVVAVDQLAFKPLLQELRALEERHDRICHAYARQVIETGGDITSIEHRRALTGCRLPLYG